MGDVQTTDINTKPAVPAIDSNDQIFISDGGTALKKISYTNLAKAIIEQYNASQLAGATKTIQTAINDLNSNISWHGVPSSVTTKALLQDYIDNQIAINGYFYGYMTANVSVNAGLGNIGHYIFAEANSTNYRLVQAVSSDNNSKYTMIKFNGTWKDWIPSKQEFIYSTSKADFVSKIQSLPDNTPFVFFAAGTTMKDLTGDSTLTSNIKGTGAKTSNYFDIVFGYYTSAVYAGRFQFSTGTFDYYKQPTRAEVDKIKTTEHPNITDVLTPAQDVTILHSYVSVRNGLVILDCHFSQTSTTKTDRFTFKTGYKPIVLNTNISPIFMYENNAVSDSILFVNPTTLTIFGASPVANREYYFRLVYFNE